MMLDSKPQVFYATKMKHLSRLPIIKKTLLLLFIFLASAFLYLFFIQKMILGDFFFGGKSYFYSLPLAQFFYKQALLLETKQGVPPPYAYYQLGRISFIKGKLDTALNYFDLEQKFYPEHHKVYYMRGLTLGYDNRNNTAIESFEEFNRLEPNSWAGINDEAWLLFKIGDLKRARTLVEDLYQKGTMSPWILNTYGVILLNEGECEAATLVLSIGQTNALKMTKEAWGRAYPGNNPLVYQGGLDAMRETFTENIKLSKEECSKRNVEN